MLLPGDRLEKNQVVCFVRDKAEYKDNTQGAFEFGLAPDGHPIFYDHLTVDPERVVWEEGSVVGAEYALFTGGAFVLYNEDDEPIWQIGGCGSDTAGGGSLKVSEDGIVELKLAGRVLWSLDLSGNAVDHCAN